MLLLDIASAFGGVLSSVPTDPVSIFVMILLVASFLAVLWFGRPRGGKGGDAA